ncbi:uncharacterized protein BX664DRAFT_337367 [Halteromyces radiatus]|uniref:uncharacterized protein n=1 Tax=Halteromyces radiatus TaxID=101107 RepID=UPI0022204D7D|nr:uncharacterized protein BX664DRAFT_337367 [Halteromyces radiatus]KAI8084605.1 hypothetical protein BX664DRAFT_337367 [Halteromyces radiatus]
MSHSYMSSLDSLALEPTDYQSSHINEEEAAADLALWTNAKFTYDTTPGQGILEEKPAFDLDKVMYEHLSKYLDMSQTLTPSLDMPMENAYKPIRPQPLLPKPMMEQPLYLLPTDVPTPTKNNDKRTEDRSADEDKRRRNTAASARFRIKKKQKEKAMAETVKEMTEKAEKLQGRVHELENEIKWLRELLLEKNSK